ncbi:MAG: YncE family protein, partial [Acidobacteriaceae bacterium]
MKRYSSPQRLGLLMVGAVVFFAGSRVRAQGVAEPHGRTIHPHALGFNAAVHRLYCVDQHADRVLVMGPAGQRSSIAVGRQPNAIAIDPALNRIYVVNAGSGNVSVIDGASDHVIATVATDKRPYAIGIDTTLHRAYVTNTFSDKVTVIDGTTNSA